MARLPRWRPKPLWLLLPASASLSGLLRLAEAQASPEPEAEPTVGQPGFVPPNAPACAAEWTSLASDLTGFATNIIAATSVCAMNLGWTGQTIYGNKKNWPFHDQQICTITIFTSASDLFSSIANMEAAAFDCFANNQACGQSILKASQDFMDCGTQLTTSGRLCQEFGGNPPFNTVSDIPNSGFFCLRAVWKTIQLLIEAAKYIDTAVAVCDSAVPEPEPEAGPAPEPEPTAQSPAPEPTKSKDAAAPEPTAESSAEPEPTLGASPGVSSWDDLQQPHPFALRVEGGGAVERRLKDIPEMPKDIREVQRAVRDFIRKFGSEEAKAALPPEEEFEMSEQKDLHL